MSRYRFAETITVNRRTAGALDDYGNATYTTTSHTVDDVVIAPGEGGDLTEYGRDGIKVAFTLYPPHGADIRADDTVTISGETYRILGPVSSWSSPLSGWAAGTTLRLERVEG